ncbi:DnaD domain protein [Weissella uvarum]|nr:DnaD domain protein [Weissella uvarum]
MGDVSISNYLLNHYQDLGMTNDELLVYIQLKNQAEHLPDIDLQQMSHNLGWSTETINNLIEQLRSKNFIDLNSQRDAQGRMTTSIDFSPLYNQIMTKQGEYTQSTASQRVKSHGEVMATTNAQNDQPTRTDIYNMIEQEFGRPLSSMELQTVRDWFDIDHFRPDFIKAALQEAVVNNALNLRYIETILVTWQKKNYHSLNDVYNERKNRQQYKQSHPETPVEHVVTDVDINQVDWSKL